MKNIDSENIKVATLQNMCIKLSLLNDNSKFSVIPEEKVIHEIKKNTLSIDRLRTIG